MLEVHIPVPDVPEKIVELLVETVEIYADIWVSDPHIEEMIGQFITEEEEPILLVDDTTGKQIKIRFGRLETYEAFLIIEEPDGRTGFTFEVSHVVVAREVWELLWAFMKALVEGKNTILTDYIDMMELEFIVGMSRILKRISDIKVGIGSDEPLVLSIDAPLWPVF